MESQTLDKLQHLPLKEVLKKLVQISLGSKVFHSIIKSVVLGQAGAEIDSEVEFKKPPILILIPQKISYERRIWLQTFYNNVDLNDYDEYLYYVLALLRAGYYNLPAFLKVFLLWYFGHISWSLFVKLVKLLRGIQLRELLKRVSQYYQSRKKFTLAEWQNEIYELKKYLIPKFKLYSLHTKEEILTKIERFNIAYYKLRVKVDRNRNKAAFVYYILVLSFILYFEGRNFEVLKPFFANLQYYMGQNTRYII